MPLSPSSSSPSLRDSVPCDGTARREDFALVPSKTALLIIDIQKYLSNLPESAAAHRDNNDDDDDSNENGAGDERDDYYSNESLPNALLRIRQLLEAFRSIRDATDDIAAATTSTGCCPCPCEVIFTYLQCLTKDGRDISLDYKLSGPLLCNIPRFGTPLEDLFLPECMPLPSKGRGDILLPKTSCSVFQSTNLDYVLRNLGKEQLVVCGQLTDQCVLSAVRDAADLGYFVTVAEDACAARSREAHGRGVLGMDGFCRIKSTNQIAQELQNCCSSENKEQEDQQQQQQQQQASAVSASSPAAVLTDDMIVRYLRDKAKLPETELDRLESQLLGNSTNTRKNNVNVNDVISCPTQIANVNINVFSSGGGGIHINSNLNQLGGLVDDDSDDANDDGNDGEIQQERQHDRLVDNDNDEDNDGKMQQERDHISTLIKAGEASAREWQQFQALLKEQQASPDLAKVETAAVADAEPQQQNNSGGGTI